MPYYTHIPFEPSNYDGFDTVNNLPFYVRALVEGGDDLVLFKNSAELDIVDKTNYLEQVGVISGVFREAASVVNLAITIEYPTVPDFNYVYVGAFRRYYTVTDFTTIRQNLWEISLSLDVLMTYKDVIKNTTAFVDRNEFEYNLLIPDPKIVVTKGVILHDIPVQNSVFDNNNINYVVCGYELTKAGLN